MNRRERHHQTDSRAVWIRHDRARPAAPLALELNQVKMIRIDFWNEKRNVFIHPVVLRVAQDDVARAGETLFDLAGDRRVESRENDFAVQRRFTRLDGLSSKALGDWFVLPPDGRFPVTLTRRSIRSRNLGQLEPRMVLEQRNELLPDRTCCAEHPNWNLFCHLFFSSLRLFASSRETFTAKSQSR